MRLEQFRNQMSEYRRVVDAEAKSRKDSYLALERLGQLYQGLRDEERALANVVLGEWAVSDDENLRFDALALIGDFENRAAVPALETLATQLATSVTPSAPFELQKVKKILSELVSGQD